ncbi:MAG: GntR family transcriptional regulator [Tannerellaceae bacterium]|jgi:DNA-binding transcriptional regulator YhcF (GntR family)|nr:GntR family transcriptional regulator [Tannerellaceae bacterium]
MKTGISLFIRIADTVCDKILSGDYQSEGRIPSVRDLAAEMEVNPNTVMRSVERLQRYEIIYNKRGVGYFVASDAREKIHKMRLANFLDNGLPSLFREMDLLGLGISELAEAYKLYKLNSSNSEQS